MTSQGDPLYLDKDRGEICEILPSQQNRDMYELEVLYDKYDEGFEYRLLFVKMG